MDAADRVLRHAGDAVDYDAISGADLDAALAAIAKADMQGMSDDEAYAFLLNAYNICVVDCVRRRLRRDGKTIGTLHNPMTWLRFFVFTPIKVAGKRHNLFTLEYLALKPHLRRDPRGHFALVCASAGCPPLKDGIYHAEALDEELDLAGRAFMQGAALDRTDRMLHLSRILKWHAKDFARLGTARDVYAMFAPAEDAQWVKDHVPRIAWQEYDWDLNLKGQQA